MTLYQMLGLTRPLILFDCETTGPDPKRDRVVELGMIILREDSEKEWRTLVNPQMPIPPGSTEKHGIDDARLLKCNRCGGGRDEEHANRQIVQYEDGLLCDQFIPVPTFKEIAPNLLRGFTTMDLAGFNIKRYDMPLLECEFEREGLKWDSSTCKVLDGNRLWQLAEPRTLSDFVKRWAGEELVGAHTAVADCRGTLKGILGLLTQVQFLPRTLDALHELQYPPKVKDPNWLDEEGKFIWDGNVPLVNFGKKWAGKPMKLVERRFWTWMMDPSNNFPADAVEIARQAHKGIFPTRGKEEGFALS